MFPSPKSTQNIDILKNNSMQVVLIKIEGYKSQQKL